MVTYNYNDSTKQLLNGVNLTCQRALRAVEGSQRKCELDGQMSHVERLRFSGSLKSSQKEKFRKVGEGKTREGFELPS